MADLMDSVMQLNQQRQANLDAYSQLVQNARVADMMVKANPDLVQRMGFDTPEQYQALSAPDKIAATTGVIKAQGVQEFQARMNDYQAQAQQRQQQTQDDQVSGALLSTTLADPKFKDDPMGALQRAAQTAAQGGQNPAAISRNFPKVMDSLAKWQQVNQSMDANNPVQVDTNSIPNNAIVTRKRGAGFQVVPTGGVNMQMVDDGQGNQIPVLVGPRGQPQQLRGSGGQLKAADALKAFNSNSLRMAQLNQQLKLAQDPQYKDAFDPDALNAELSALQDQQTQLKSVWSPDAKTAPTIKTSNGGTAQPTPADVKYLRANPRLEALFEQRFGKGSARQFLP